MTNLRHATIPPAARRAAVAAGVLAVLLLPAAADAVLGLETVRSIATGQGITPPQGSATFSFVRKVIVQFARFLLYIIGAVALLSIVYGGFLYVSSAGDEGRAQRGKTALLYAAIGLLIASLSAALVNFFVT